MYNLELVWPEVSDILDKRLPDFAKYTSNRVYSGTKIPSPKTVELIKEIFRKQNAQNKKTKE